MSTETIPTYGISTRSYSILMDYLKEQHSIEKVILFGSRATGKARNGSDIDLAISGDISFEEKLHFQAHINQILPIPYTVDLVHLESVEDENLLRHIEQFGKTLLEMK